VRGLAVAVAVVLIVGCGSGRADRGADVKANEALFRQLPRLPRARVARVTSSPRAGGEDKPVAGYVTRFELRLPGGTSAASVVRFYERTMRPRWRLIERLDGPVLNFRRREALVSVNLENVAFGSAEIAVDHSSYS
jgi:hypothetical protein